MSDKNNPVIAYGAPYEGGFYGGMVRIGEAIFGIAWAPKAEGELTGVWMNKRTAIVGSTSYFDSMANTRAMADAGSPIAKAALAANINGHTDWCIPARDVLEMAYRHLKPTARENYASFRDGDNPSSVPAGYPYTGKNPALTQAIAFQEGGEQAFDAVWHWSSTQYSEGDAWGQDFTSGDQYYLHKHHAMRCRFVRLIQLNA